jgi:hypothetical protein
MVGTTIGDDCSGGADVVVVEEAGTDDFLCTLSGLTPLEEPFVFATRGTGAGLGNESPRIGFC